LLTDAGQLRPLLEGIGTLVVNGDAAELLLESRSAAGREQLEKLRGLCRQAGVEAVFVNGNHDPEISTINHLDLCDGAILATHGDMLFTDLAPWCHGSLAIGRVHREMLDAMDDTLLEDFEARLRLVKNAIVTVGLPELNVPQGVFARWLLFIQEAWPPTRPFTILRCWRESPRRAAALARVFRPRARFVLVGHVHRPGVHRLGPRVVINTGSFTPLLGRLAVDIAGDTLTVRQIRQVRGSYTVGKEIAHFPITPLSPLDTENEAASPPIMKLGHVARRFFLKK